MSTLKIKVLRDESYSALMYALADESERVQELLDEYEHPPLTPGSVLEVDEWFIDDTGKVHFFRDDVQEAWYLPQGWYVVLDD